MGLPRSVNSRTNILDRYCLTSRLDVHEVTIIKTCTECKKEKIIVLDLGTYHLCRECADKLHDERFKNEHSSKDT